MNFKRMSAIYPGSFDPITNGHVDLIKRLSDLFEHLVVLVSVSYKKNYLFSLNERQELILSCLKGVSRVEVCSHNGMTVEYARKNRIRTIIRGVRAVSDFEYELTMAAANKKLFPECETFIAFTRPEYTHLSSQVVKEIASHGGDLSNWLPEPVEKALKNKFV